MKVIEGLFVLELGDADRRMHPTLIVDKENVILIDTGLPGQLQEISDSMEKLGLTLDQINKIIITHQDFDHIGNLASIVKASSHKVEVLSHTKEKPYIDGSKMSVKMTPERMNSMTEEKRKDWMDMFHKIKSEVTVTIEDGEVMDVCGGIEVIDTPGHTPGHICLYLQKYKTLVTGDALNVMEGNLVGPNPVFTYDMDLAKESLKKLEKYEIQMAIAYHGGVYSRNPKERITEIINR